MSRNNTLQDELLISGITIDEAMAAEIATLNVEGKPMANFYYISFNLGLHRGRGQQMDYTSGAIEPILAAEDPERASKV